MSRILPLAIIDSGVGGLSVLREFRTQMPCAALTYFADQAHLPYGERGLDELYGIARGITRFLSSCGTQVLVLACNTLSTAALHRLRDEFPGLSFVGMEPAVKPAAAITRSGRIGVIATSATFQGELFASVVERFTSESEVLTQACPGLATRIEAGDTSSPELVELLEAWLLPLKENGIDCLVLGCTHYSFVRPAIENILGPSIAIVDPAAAVAKQTLRILEERSLTLPADASCNWLTTAEAPASFAGTAGTLLDMPVEVKQICWQDGELIAEQP